MAEIKEKNPAHAHQGSGRRGSRAENNGGIRRGSIAAASWAAQAELVAADPHRRNPRLALKEGYLAAVPMARSYAARAVRWLQRASASEASALASDVCVSSRSVMSAAPVW